MAFSRYCLELRKSRGLSQLELSEILGLSFSQLRNLEKERSKLPKPEVIQRLAGYLDKDVFDVVYDIYFNDDGRQDACDPSVANNRTYLVSKLFDGYTIESYTSFTDNNDQQVQFEGSFWKTGYPNKRCLVCTCHRNMYLSASDHQNKTEALKKAILSDTFFVENLTDTDSFVEVRFILDKNNETDRHIYNEIRNIRLVNVGKKVDISYVLFDSERKYNNSNAELHYITNKTTSIKL